MKIFITGTDTGVGKTIVSAWLTHHLEADYWKPIQSGASEGRDAETVRELSGAASERIHQEIYSFKKSLSPHLAAQHEGVEISLKKIIPPSTKKTLIIEGAGGVYTPLNRKENMMDLILKLNAPVIVVARSMLGTINHTCLTLEALRERKIPILGVIMNGSKNEDNRKAIEYYGKTKVLARIENFEPMTKKKIAKYALPLELKKLFKKSRRDQTSREV